MSNQDGTGAKAAKAPELQTHQDRITELEMSKAAKDPKWKLQGRDNLITYYEQKLREMPKDEEHANERAALEQMIEDARKMLRGEEL